MLHSLPDHLRQRRLPSNLLDLGKGGLFLKLSAGCGVERARPTAAPVPHWRPARPGGAARRGDAGVRPSRPWRTAPRLSGRRWQSRGTHAENKRAERASPETHIGNTRLAGHGKGRSPGRHWPGDGIDVLMVVGVIWLRGSATAHRRPGATSDDERACEEKSAPNTSKSGP